MSKRSSKLLLEDILHSANKIIKYTHQLSFEEFANDELIIDAVVRNFEIIGEAANRLTEEFKKQYTSIDWFRLRGFRNRIVHDYMGIDYEIVWNIKKDFLPLLIIEVEQIMESM